MALNYFSGRRKNIDHRPTGMTFEHRMEEQSGQEGTMTYFQWDVVSARLC